MVLGVTGRPIVRGAYRVPRKGAVLIAVNHRADIDAPLVMIGCSRIVRFMAKSELFDIPLVGRFLRWAGAFEVHRGEADRASLRTAVELLVEGNAVCVFPEGKLTETGDLQPLKAGVALIARQAACPVICLGICHSDRVLPYGAVIPRLSATRIELNWGELRTFDRHDSSDEILGWIEGQLRMLTED
jgi:1-acyl-sn-glycerol-3-phosphate acyltransferase